MKTNAVNNYPFTGEYWGYTRTTNTDGTFNYSYYFTRNVDMALSVNILGQLVIHSKEKMQLTGKIKNIVDRNGEEIYENGEWTITQTAPLLGALGTKEGYQYKADLTAGNI